LAAFFLADFSVGFFLGAPFAPFAAEVRPRLDLLPGAFFFDGEARRAVFFFAGAPRAACFFPCFRVVFAPADLRGAPAFLLSFFFAVFVVLDRFAAFFADLREPPPAGFCAMRALLQSDRPTVNAKPRRLC
jgi:hypothetical protein